MDRVQVSAESDLVPCSFDNNGVSVYVINSNAVYTCLNGGWINQNSGLFSLLAVIASVIVPIAIFKKQRKSRRTDGRRNGKTAFLMCVPCYLFWQISFGFI